MNHVELIDRIADQFAARYRAHLLSVVGIYARILDATDPTTVKARTELRRALERVGAEFMLGLEVQANALAHEVKNATLGTLGAPGTLTIDEHVTELVEGLLGTLGTCVSRDNKLAECELRKFALGVSLLESSTGMSHVGALIKSKHGAVRGLPFVQSDRLGRKRTSEAFVRNAARQELVAIHIETALFVIASEGVDLAQVIYQDGEAGEVFSITGTTPGYRTYESIKDEIFHPNSTATVIAFKE